MKIKSLNHEEHEERATKKSIMRLLVLRPSAFHQGASLREVFLRVLRVLRGSIFSALGELAAEVMA
jgi:hypothetical protein